MGILTDIQGIQTISSTSTQGVISTSNSNFKKLTNALYKLLTDIGYSEDELSISIKKLIADSISTNGTISVNNESGQMISLDANGRIYAENSIRSKVFVESPLFKVDSISSVPKYGSGGEIVYARNSNGNYDFFGYINEIGWVSLTEDETTHPSPIGDVNNLESWSASVESIITELPNPPVSGIRYVVSQNAVGELAQYAGQIAYYNDLASKWEYSVPEAGAFVVVKDEGNIIYVSAVNGSSIIWERASISNEIGEASSGLNKFSSDSTVAYAINLLDNELLDIYHEALDAFKHSQGVGYTGNAADGYFPSKTYTDSNSIYFDSVLDNNENVKVQLTRISDRAYKIPDEDVRTLLSPAYGINFEAKPMSGGAYISSETYFVDYNSGIVFFKDAPEVTPDKLDMYKYTGQFLSDKIVVNNPNKDMRVPTNVENADLSTTGISTTIDYRGYIDVKINGISSTVCDGDSSADRTNFDCYFSIDGGNTPISYINAIIPAGAILYWNSIKAGYIIDTEDVVSFLYI